MHRTTVNCDQTFFFDRMKRKEMYCYKCNYFSPQTNPKYNYATKAKLISLKKKSITLMGYKTIFRLCSDIINLKLTIVTF